MIALVLADKLLFSSDPRFCPIGLETLLEEREDLAVEDGPPLGEFVLDEDPPALSPDIVTFLSINFSRTFVPSNSIFFRFTLIEKINDFIFYLMVTIYLIGS